ncbi:orexin receptor type 2-like [Saccostrea cucullata]|uniref:orexin receptor type 2-like n=1 Tax=Saccostrea cuccullata TaxID=36930 RepID=UPI002ED20EAF
MLSSTMNTLNITHINSSPGYNDSFEISSTLDPYLILKELNDEAALRFLPVTLFLVILMVIGTAGNVIVGIIYTKRRKKTTSDFFILNLAFLDLLTCAIGIPMEIADLSFSYTFDAPAACKILRTIESWTSMASALTLVIISIDRYKRICKFGDNFSNKAVKRLCLLALLVGALLAWPALIMVGKKTINLGIPGVKGADCSTSDEMKKTVYPLIYYGVIMLCFIVCVVFVIFVYVRISFFIKRAKTERRKVIGPNEVSNTTLSLHQIPLMNVNINHFESVHSTPSNEDDINGTEPAHARVTKQTSAVKVTRTTTIFVAITIAFIVSYLPFLAVMILRNVVKGLEKDMSPVGEVFYKFCLKSFFINNAINPLIYSFLCRKFKQDVKAMFKCELVR